MTYSSLVCNARVLFSTLCAAIFFTVYGVLEPILSLRLSDYELGDSVSGLIFGIEPLAYMLSTFMIPYIVPSWVEHRVTLITSSLLLSLATTLIGPFYTDESLTVMIIGLTLSGFFMGFMIIPNMPEMMIASTEAFPACNLDHMNSMLSGMLNAGFGVG